MSDLKPGQHVAIVFDPRWPAQVWPHDGDSPIALFETAADAHLFNGAAGMLDALYQCELWLGTFPDGKKMQAICQKAILAAKGQPA